MKTKFEKGIAFKKAHIFPCKYKNLQNIPHWHKEHELVFVQAGSVSVMENGNSFTLSAGTAAFLHSETVHSIQSAPDAVTVVAKVDAAYFQKLIGDKTLRSPVLEHDYDLPALFTELFAELKEGCEYGGIVADSIATKLLAQIFRQESIGAPGTARKDTAERYKSLLDLIATDHAYITFEDAADYMHFSKPYFSEFFYNHAGMTFTRYLNMIKISFATERVLEGKLSITEISKACGFNTIRNFNRVFKELTGYTPNRLPKDYNFIHNLKEYTDSGFDPTLNCSEILES